MPLEIGRAFNALLLSEEAPCFPTVFIVVDGQAHGIGIGSAGTWKLSLPTAGAQPAKLHLHPPRQHVTIDVQMGVRSGGAEKGRSMVRSLMRAALNYCRVVRGLRLKQPIPVDPLTERTRDSFEDVAGYSRPALIAVPPFDQLIFAEDAQIEYKRLPRWVIRAGWRLTGFGAFHRSLPARLDALLQSPRRIVPVPGPVQAVTLALKQSAVHRTAVDRASGLVRGAWMLYRNVHDARLPQDQDHGVDLDMSQYLNLFATSLVSDGRRLRLHKAGVVSHIVVACKGAFHALTISDGRSIASYQEIRRALGEIIARAGDPAMAERSNSPALLVCAPGEMQIGTFELAKQYPENRRSLELLTSAFLVLCLDLDDLPDSAAEAALMAHARNVENRWYRASMQLVVFGNARACVIANPAASLSGNVMVRGAGEIQRNAEMSIDSEENGIAVPPAEGLKWTIHQSQLDLAARCWKALCNPQPATFQIDGEWKRTFEQHGLAPVCVFVVALQWAIRRLIGEVPVIDQFLAMTRFRYLTLKTAQVSTPEVLACCDYIDAGGYHAGMAASLLKRAAQSQAQACRNARKKMDLWWAWNLFLLDASRYADVKHIRWVAERFSAPAESMKRPKHVLISHPKADPAVELIGRPGVLYPFAKYFTLHYQIADSTISCVLAPAQGWKVSTAAFKSALADCLSAISTILAGADGEQSGDALPGIAAHSDGLLQKVDQKRRPQ